MEKMQIKYRLSGKAIPPQPIKLAIPGWAGGDVKKRNGSEPQPWHCPPWAEAAIAGVELLYQYETECHVINDRGNIGFAWDFKKEPGYTLTGGEFGTFFPRPSKFYFFATGIDLQAPPGYVLHTQPHPKYFTDDSGTTPLSLIGDVQTEWWSKKLFVVFRVPPPGHRHIFRKGEPYAQVLFIPQDQGVQLVQMSPEEEAQRAEMEQQVQTAQSHIAKNVWHNPSGQEFKDHYRVMARAFAAEGMGGVKQTIDHASERQKLCQPADKSIEECLELAADRQREGANIEARDIYFHVIGREPNHAEATRRLGMLAASMDLPMLAHQLLSRAVVLQPQSAVYRADLGSVLLKMGRVEDARSSYQAALGIDPLLESAQAGMAEIKAKTGR